VIMKACRGGRQVLAADVAGALATGWDAFRSAAGDDLTGWDAAVHAIYARCQSPVPAGAPLPVQKI